MQLPAYNADPFEWLTFEQAGVVTWHQATSHLSPSKVRHLLASRRWRRLSRGLLITFTGPLGPPQHHSAAVLAAGSGALLAGLAAAEAGGLRARWRRRREVIDVLIPAGRRAPDLLRRLPAELPAVKVHRTTALPEQDRQRGRPERTALPRSVVDAAQWALTEDEARMTVAAACQQRLLLPSEINSVLERMPTVRRRALVRRTAEDAAGGAHSLAEIDLDRLCRRFGLPRPERQHQRHDSAGRLRYLDAYWPQFRLVVEVDGAHHTDVAQWEADLRRQNAIWVQGERILRFTSYQLRHRPAEVADVIRQALVAAGWRP
ncbi:endonuclease domain-containing protein [Natronosporangium hydrolyticum]|uniref:endonuclease domain-containing protein n=1 Tax=Natronosporangium hydrolyticum TaxID=2811111 RepID=UPI001EFA0C2E|nr:DUF559 domain-containing protein [Natronosporangium hydrolyticum]